MFRQLRARVGQYSQILAMRLYAAGAGFLVTLLLGRLLGPAEFGAFVFAMGWVSIFALLSTFGFHQFAIRALPPLILEEKRSDAAGLALFSAAMVTGLALIVTLLVSLNKSLFSSDPHLQSAVLVAAFLFVPTAWMQLRTGLLQGLGHPVAGQVPERLITPTLLVVTLGLCVLLAWDISAQAVLWLTIAATLVSLALGLPALRSATRDIAARPNFGSAVAWMAGSGQFLLAYAALTVLGATDVIMLGMLSTTEETGVYGVAARFFLLMNLPLHAGAVFVSQRAAMLHAQNDIRGLAGVAQGAANRGFLAALALALPCTVMAFYAEPVFGAGFDVAFWPILILVWTRVLQSVGGVPGAVLANTGFVGSVAIASVLVAVINIALNAALIPRFGAVGAATATALSFTVMTVGQIALLRARLGVWSFIGLGSMKTP